MIPFLPKCMIDTLQHNLNYQVSHNYSIIEELTQDPCVMFTLKILQRCLVQWKNILIAIGTFNHFDSHPMTIDFHNSKP